ncbi:MAG TPA: hypothetical protein VFX61_00285 [Micromonosporaceae bacterium]|nr:hypothetical protein [Micromonosporaceae bacterium]
MSRSEILRLRRQMHRRIREVVAERRLARLDQATNADPDPGLITVESRSHCECSLVSGGPTPCEA